jgi:hypothetical protein
MMDSITELGPVGCGRGEDRAGDHVIFSIVPVPKNSLELEEASVSMVSYSCASD